MSPNFEYLVDALDSNVALLENRAIDSAETPLRDLTRARDLIRFDHDRLDQLKQHLLQGDTYVLLCSVSAPECRLKIYITYNLWIRENRWIRRKCTKCFLFHRNLSLSEGIEGWRHTLAGGLYSIMKFEQGIRKEQHLKVMNLIVVKARAFCPVHACSILLLTVRMIARRQNSLPVQLRQTK